MENSYCVIVPCYNEEESIAQTIAEIRKSNGDISIIAINDGSTDRTSEVLSLLECKSLNFVSNLGIGGAVQAGFMWALQNGYGAAIQIDADGQHPPAYIADLIATFEGSNCEMVIGSRNLGLKSSSTTKLRKIGNRFISSWINLLFPIGRITDSTSGMRLVGKPGLELFSNDYPNDYPEPIAIAHMKSKGMRVVEIPIQMRSRKAGISSISSAHSPFYMFRVLSYITLLWLSSINRRKHE